MSGGRLIELQNCNDIKEARGTLFWFTGRKHLLQLKYLRGFNLFGLVGKLESSVFLWVLLNITVEESLLLLPGQKKHSQRGPISFTVNFNTNKSPEVFRKSILLAIKRLNQAVHCSLYFVQLPEMKYFPHPQTKCHHSEAGITKKKNSFCTFVFLQHSSSRNRTVALLYFPPPPPDLHCPCPDTYSSDWLLPFPPTTLENY